MDGMAPSQIAALVSPARVHRSVYTDPALFELEMQRIWGRAWIFVGHDSQVKRPGDFFATRIGRQPVVMTRHADGSVRVLYNRCGHRGAMVVADESGHVDAFRCCYHGWSFATDGRLVSVPLRDGYGPDFDMSDPALGMAPVARVDAYRGFVFASLAADGPGLAEFLGPMTSSLDDLVDRAPDGEVEVAGGIARHGYDGNWKLVLENLCDGLHPLSVHISSIEAARAQDDDAFTDGAGEIAVTQMRQNGAPFDFWQNQVGMWAYPFGHSYLGDYHSDARLVAAMENPVFRDYAATMEAAYGKIRATEILSVGRWNSNIYPSISFMSQFRQLRVIHPVAVGRTEVFGFCFRLKGAPDSMFADTIRFANITNATASPVLTDDLETYFRIRRGLTTQGSDWIATSRALGTDVAEPDGGLRAVDGTSELHIRNMMQAWTDYMADGGA
jgi:phenylpropionate dioxygenase-like ring-hydroxylating dioxygenase large terminal subunit